MATLAALTAHLESINQRLTKFLVPGPLERERIEERAAQLERISEELRLVLRDLKSSESRIQVQRSALRTAVPREKRWSAAQSLAQREDNIRSVRDEAERLADRVRKLLEQNGFISPMDAAKKITELMEQIEKLTGHIGSAQPIALQRAASGPAYLPASGTPAGTVTELHSFVPLVTFAYLGVRLVVRRLRDALKSGAGSKLSG